MQSKHITLISGTNRPESRTRMVTDYYASVLKSKSVPFHILDLAELPDDVFAFRAEIHPVLHKLTEQFIRPVDRLIVISPEYNGSIPGVLKALIDHTDIKAWYNKKCCLAGIATGRAGNLRGLDHMTNILMHCKSTVLPNKLPIASIHNLLDLSGFSDEGTRNAIQLQIDEFLAF